MGGGGRMSTSRSIYTENVLHRQPVATPPFTLQEIKKVIPPHCFHRHLFKSLFYVIQDLLIVAILYYIATTFIPLIPSPYSYLAWPVYWFLQGSIFSGLWIIGHDCGHHAFSDYRWVNDVVGFFLHSAINTPYFSFKYTHRIHHANTNSIEDDQIYIPSRKESVKLITRVLNNPPGRLLMLAFWLVFGYPLYLYTNFTSRKHERFTNHFDPYSPIFNSRERFQVIISDLGVIVFNGLLATQGIHWVIFIYGIPLLVSSVFFTLITYLNHTHPSVPFYDSKEWNWLRGALSTIDRDFGFLNKIFHDIPRTHVLHHLLPNIPHYHALEATAAIKPVLGEYYKNDETPILEAIWRETKECVFVEADVSERKGVLWFRKF